MDSVRRIYRVKDDVNFYYESKVILESNTGKSVRYVWLIEFIQFFCRL